MKSHSAFVSIVPVLKLPTFIDYTRYSSVDYGASASLFYLNAITSNWIVLETIPNGGTAYCGATSNQPIVRIN